MPKKSFREDPATLAYISNAAEPDQEETEEPKKPARGTKPLVRRTDGGSASQAGLPADYTRTTFIISVQNKQNIEDLAYTNRESIKDTLEGILNGYFEEYGKSHKLLHKKR